MEYLIYLLLPFIWFFMLLEWIYEKFCKLVNFFTGDPEPKGNGRDERRTQTTEKQRKIIRPDRIPPTDDGMNPQERTIPYHTEERKPEPVKEKPPEFVFETPKRHTLKTNDKKRDKERRGMEM